MLIFCAVGTELLFNAAIKLMRDFTLSRYLDLLYVLKAKGYAIHPDAGPHDPEQRSVILRHDIDAMPSKALAMARVENREGVRSSWFFKTSPDTFLPQVIRQIASMGHRIGYHYEDLVRNHGNYEKAISGFERNLEALRMVFPVTTICADGDPLSKYSNLWLWDKYDYKRYGITHESYLDINYDVHAYYTDTARRWNGYQFNVWDHVKSTTQWPRYHSTADIIRAVEEGTFPLKSAMNFHPQRWNDNLYDWTKRTCVAECEKCG